MRTFTSVALSGSDAELAEAFSRLRTRQDVAALLAVTDRELIYVLYRGGSCYHVFDIPKRSGGTRKICAPAGSIKIIQKRLNQVLQAIYKPKAPVHGFARDRSIVTNADAHIRKRVVLNIDLADFFPTIHFGRVRGVFAKPPYGLPIDVAQVLAQICTYDRALPQGAPTSPIVSNMVCVSLDSGLRTLAQTHGCTYTRYADDITFSTTRRHLAPEVAKITADAAGVRTVVIGQSLLRRG
jgi:RNA-directed DNA polymerase